MMQFYVYLNGEKRGPLSEERVQTLLSEGLLLGSDLAGDQPDGELRALSAYRRFSTTSADNAEVAGPLSPSQSGTGALPSPYAAMKGAAPVATADLVDSPLPPLTLDALGPYARETLAPDERPFYKTSLHWIVFARFGVMALLAFLFIAMPFAIGVQALTGSQIGWFALPLPTLMVLPPTLAFASSELVITDKRVLIKTGIVSRQTLEMFIARIESVAVQQDVLGRMFDYGTVTIRGMGGSEEAFEAIARPIEFRNAVQRLQSVAAPDARPYDVPR